MPSPDRPVLTLEDAELWCAEHYGLAGRASDLPSYSDRNFLIESDTGHFALKVARSSVDRQDLEFENAAIDRLAERCPEVPVAEVLRNRDGHRIGTIESARGSYLCRLLTFLPGRPMAESPPKERRQLERLGSAVGQVARALADFEHPRDQRRHTWDLRHGAEHRDKVRFVVDAQNRELAERAFALFAGCALPMLPTLRQSVIHNDLNDYNLLIDSAGELCGLIDFGDLVRAATVCDLAIACAYAALRQDDPLAAVEAVVQGCHQVLALDDEEFEVLHPLLLGRLATSVVMSSKGQQEEPENEYLAISQLPAWTALRQLIELSPRDAADRYRTACGKLPIGAPGRSPAELIESRRRHLGPSLSLSYQRPLKIVRGRGQYLYDHRGRPFLDLVNNVCHVGHCHPRVVEAAQRQIAELNTNTRYLYDGLADYSERLTALLPEPLSVCFLVSSGSEANELALRLARTATGRRDLLVVDAAYHGHTAALIEASPYKFMGRGGRGRAEDHIHVVPMPDGYRGPIRGSGAELGQRYGDTVDQAARVAAERGTPVAGFICEPLLGCGGQVVLPEGYLATAFDHVRTAGGVCIADEVQVGFGRVGSHLWGFETQNVVPDIVTLGKPIGNGHPMAAVVTTPEIAHAFANGMEYFATFGGNPVSCAVGLAVLEVIEQEQLQANARRVGKRFVDGLCELGERHPLIGEVRGCGLFLGVELVRDHTTLEPATDEASQIVEAMRARGILLSIDGPLHNVLKIKPPMVISEHDADFVTRSLDRVLTSLASDG